MASAIIVFSHLRWDFVFQRPQHLLSRLAKHHPIVIVEEPIYDEKNACLATYSPAPNVLVCQPHTPVSMPGFHDDHLPHLQKLLRGLVRDYEDHIAWFYTPMALPLLKELQPRLVVYDCMDELAAFKNAPKQLLQRESALLKVADIVFTGGQSLYRSKRDRHPNVHCFPSSVDASHFVQALDRANSHPAHREIPGPRMGFYGVIDERFDTKLIGKVADAHPMWQIVLVGPVVKIDPATLPQRPNIHYLGQQPYEALPQFLAGWDVCLLPFALNESTRFISPTKTLEYMAAELPIVSTPVADVADAYSDIVAIAPDAESFIAACEAALLASPEEHLRKVEGMRRVLASTSWDSTAEQMHHLLMTTPRRVPEPAVSVEKTMETADAGANVSANVNVLRQQETRFARTAIIGAGPTGLSAAYHLGHDTVLLEKNEMVGGWCRSVKDKGFTFDHAGHMMFSNDPDVLELYDILLGSNIHWQEREAWIYSKNTYTRYPFQSAQARAAGLHADGADCCTDGGIALQQGKVASLEPGARPAGLNARFGYPLRGGLQALMSGFVPHIKGTIELNAEVAHVSPKQHIVTLADGRRYEYENLISTMPLPELVRMIGDEASEEVRHAAQGLRHVSVRYVNIGVAREKITDKHWIYYPEDDIVFHRIFAQGNASPECSPPGGFGITCEISYSAQTKPLPASGQELIERCIRDCIKVGMLRSDDEIMIAHEVDMPYAYVMYDQARERNMAVIKSWLAMYDITLAGRYSEWEYFNFDHAFLAGKKAAEAIKWVEVEAKSAIARNSGVGLK